MKIKTDNRLTPDETSVILDSVADGVFTVDENFTITSFNRAAESITGVPREEAMGKECCEVFKADICEADCALRHTTRTGKPVINRSISILNARGERVPISVSTALLKDKHGKIIGGVETFRDLSVVEALRQEVEGRYRLADMISRNEKMRDIFNILPDIAQSGSTVLIEGESGTGKELLARAIHDMSTRKKGPMIAVNCGAIPDTLLESELFGYVAGAFTDAKRDKKGKFAIAEGGTLFLDEIGDVSPALQVRLLRVLQERQYEPLGSNRTLRADVRVIAATNRDLATLVKKGQFRSDLFYRINVIRLYLPPLRDRKEDIPLLVDHIVRQMNLARNRDISGVDRAVQEAFFNHDWPGNIRELENALEHAFILCPGGQIHLHHLPDTFSFRGKGGSSGSQGETPAGTLEDLEAKAIQETLIRNDWNRTAASAELGINKTTLWRKCKRFGIFPPG
ncbi:MAG: sigma 54-interacting transcriptional regulator [Proteobacteria bacterium]|nr:sigma 54-interacting transcriptional regulator [Pseudomonadota bacterium]